MKITSAPRVIISPHNQAAPKGRTLIEHDNEINDLETAESKYAKLESWICRNIGAKLASVYPNREWRIETDLENGMIVIQLPVVSTEKGYHVHMGTRTMHELQGRAVQAAGEILERYALSRGKSYNPDHAEALPRRRVKQDEAIGPGSRAESITGSGKVLKDGET